MKLEDTISVIDTLKNLDLLTYPIDDIITNIKKLRAFPAHATEFHAENLVYRIRTNEDGRSFQNVEDLSYKPQEYNNSYQRASLPEQTMFYGTIIPAANRESEIDVGRVIAIAEGSRLMRNHGIENGEELVTFGMWRLHARAALATILHPELPKNISPFAIQRAKEFMEWLDGYSDISAQGKIILEFYADEFAKMVESSDPDYKYLHTAILTDFLLQQGFDGICYPSTRTEGKGINVAIHPNFINAHMRLEGAMECTCKRG